MALIITSQMFGLGTRRKTELTAVDPCWRHAGVADTIPNPRPNTKRVSAAGIVVEAELSYVWPRCPAIVRLGRLGDLPNWAELSVSRDRFTEIAKFAGAMES